MDRLNQIRGEADRSKDFTLDTSSAPSEAYVTANEGSSKFFSLSEVDSTFSVSPTKDNNSAPANIVSPITDSDLISNLSPIPKPNDLGSFKIGKQIEAANILSGGVNIFDDNSYDGDELVIDDNVTADDSKTNSEVKTEEVSNITSIGKADDVLETANVEEAIESKDTEVVLQIDGKNVDAIHIGNGLYLYRKPGEEELAAVQIVDDNQQQPSFKFLKVRENAEGNLEVYEEIEIEVPKEVPTKNEEPKDNKQNKNPIKDDKPSIESDSNKNTENANKCPQIEVESHELQLEPSKELKEESTVNFNGKMMKFSESRKSPVISTFTPMTYHSTPNKDGIPLTKTMVDQQLHPNRHSDNIKKTIEVHTESSKQKLTDTPTTYKEPIANNDNDEKDNKDKILSPHTHTSKNKLLVIEHKDCVKDKIIDNTFKQNDIKESVDLNLTDSHVSNENVLKGPIEAPVVNIDKGIHFTDKSLSEKSTEDAKNPDASVGNLPAITFISDSYLSADDINLIGSDGTKETDITCYDPTEVKGGIINKEPDPKNKTDITSSDTRVEEKESEKEKLSKAVIPHDLESLNKAYNIEQIAKECQDIPKQPSDIKITDIHPISLKCIENRTRIENIKDNHEALKPKTDINMIKNVISQKTCENQTKSNANITNNINESVRGNREQALEDLKCNNIFPLENKILETQKPVPQLPVKINVSDIEKETKKEKLVSTQTKQIIKKNCAAVPFGMWTEANRQEFLNKIKETKVVSNNSNTKQLKQPNDLNRRDVLKKIDSQRQSYNIVSTKGQEVNSCNKSKITTVTFKNKPKFEQTNNTQVVEVTTNDKSTCLKDNSILKTTSEKSQNKLDADLPVAKKVPQRKEINNQDLIDKTIEGIINRALPVKNSQEDKQTVESNATDKEKNAYPVTLDDIERKMNELHGIPFVERPIHELPALTQETVSPNNLDIKNSNVNQPDTLNVNPPETLIYLPPFTNKLQQNIIKEHDKANISDEEIIEHVPITGDINLSCKDKMGHELVGNKMCDSGAKKEPIITEKDFDKFARRNSITYENRITVNFDRKEPHNVINTIVPKEIAGKKMSRNELMLAESKAKSTNKHNVMRHNNHSSKIPTAVKACNNDIYNKNYQSKVQIAYQSALTAKRQLEGPITIIEDKPVKVVFMDTNADFVPVLNVQGQELSSSKVQINESDKFVHSASESLDSDILESYENKLQDDVKSKSKHQRKQVLTPVETPELELIEPSDLGMDISPKKKHRLDEKIDKKAKTLVPKKSYLLNRNVGEDKRDRAKDSTDLVNRPEPYVVHTDPISAIDNLVKAAELLETQSENTMLSNESENNIQQNTPAKRGRGRPRKYPLPGTESNVTKTPSPQKKTRLQEERTYKEHTETEESSDDEMIKENWTMGKINENIVCPICGKLFRSENVVFKHVKHCTGPSPNRSDSDKRSSSRLRHSQEFKRSSTESKSEDMDLCDWTEETITTPKKRKSRDSKATKEKRDEIFKQHSDSENDIEHESHKTINKTKLKTNNIVCELCGKSFRQLSYLLNHKLQHKNEEVKKINVVEVNKNIFCCEVCKKQFRKLHHLVQHRLIHKPNAMSSRLSRKTSAEHRDNKIDNDNKISALAEKTEDHSAGFRCEPCDKSFRKLHHLVEHRETHDGINKKCAPQNTADTVKSPSHQCDICKKSFKKLQHLMEHKDQHLETSSEKSDDKSVQSSLSTRDIIHECSLCYMVFPNEHSLNKHTVICLRKKKQSVAKQAKQAAEKESTIDHDDNKEDIDEKTIDKSVGDSVPIKEKQLGIVNINKQEVISDVHSVNPTENHTTVEDSDSKSDDVPLIKVKKSELVIEKPKNDVEIKPLKTTIIDTIIIPDTPTPKKRTASKGKMGVTVTKKRKTLNITMPVIEGNKSAVIASNDDEEDEDDDEVRYMLNPDFKPDNTVEEKFMKVRAQKRNSLQIERPNSKNFAIRRISLQHPPKIPRLKAKPVEAKVQTSVKNIKASIVAPVPSTDSDDSDVKYSFPKTTVVKQTQKKVEKTNKKLLASKRKSLTSITKRTSMGKQKFKTPVKQIRKRIGEVEHRCDCGQLFSSAALLSRHTTLAHTPPRIRRRRSPLPDTKSQKPLNLPKPSTKQSQPLVAQPKPQSQQQNPISKQKPTLTKQKHILTQQKQTPPQQKQILIQQKSTITQSSSTTARSKSSNVTNANKSSKVGVATRKSSVIK